MKISVILFGNGTAFSGLNFKRAGMGVQTCLLGYVFGVAFYLKIN